MSKMFLLMYFCIKCLITIKALNLTGYLLKLNKVFFKVNTLFDSYFPILSLLRKKRNIDTEMYVMFHFLKKKKKKSYFNLEILFRMSLNVL